MRASITADHPFVRREVPFDEGREIEEADGQTFKVEILDDLRHRAEESGEPMPPVSFYEHGPFRDLCKGPHVESTGRIGPFKLLVGRGRVLARRREAADAPADLRHGLGDAAGSRSVSRAARGGDAGAIIASSASSSTCSASMTSRRDRPSGTRRASGSGARSRRRCASSRIAGATTRSRRRSSSRSGCGASRATGTTTPTTCSSSRPRARSSRSSR